MEADPTHHPECEQELLLVAQLQLHPREQESLSAPVLTQRLWLLEENREPEPEPELVRSNSEPEVSCLIC